MLGEALVEPEFCREVYEIARRLPGVELIFSSDISQLIASQHFLVEPQPFEPAGTLHSWSAFLARELVAAYPRRFLRCPRFRVSHQVLGAAL